MQKLHRTFLLATTMASMLLLPVAQAQTTEQIDSIVALVDEDIILRTELETAIDGVIQQIRQTGGNMPPRHLLESQVLERLIVRKLQVQRALQTGIRVSDSDIDQMLMDMAQRNNLSVAQLRGIIETEGEDFGEFRKGIGEQIMMQRLNSRVVNSMDPVSETEIDILVASEDFSGGEYEISHIMIMVPDGATPREIDQVKGEIDKIHQQLNEGLDFSSAAISFSQAQDALEGGDIGWRTLSSMPREFADAVRGMDVGQYTPPLRSPGGYHIVKVNDYRDSTQIMAEEFRANHLMITPNELLSERDAMIQIRELRDQILEGGEFDALAREYSDDTTSANIGGDLGWFPPQKFGERFQVTLESLEDGEISEPFQTESGWHLIQRTGYRETDVTEQAMRNMARQTIMKQRADTEIESFLRQLREEAFVEIRI